MKVLMIIAPENFQDKEFFEPKEVFEREGYKITVASKFVKVAKSMAGNETDVDLDLSEVKTDDYDAVIFCGGTGAIKYQQDNEALRIAKEAKKVLAAICIAPTILAFAGVLEGKKATVWNGNEEPSKLLKSKGAIFVDEKVVVDGNLVTGNGPGAARKFGEKIVEVLKRKAL